MKKKVICLAIMISCFLLIVTACGKSEGKEEVDKYVGMWMDLSEKSCFMTIECEDGENFTIDIYWEEENSIHMSLNGNYDAKEGGITYTGTKIQEIHDDESYEEIIEYDDSEGLIYFNQDGELYWKDDTENLGENCVFVRADTEEQVAEPEEVNNDGYAGIWLSQPTGQEAYTIYAEGIWIKNYTDESVEFETAYFVGIPNYYNPKKYEWEIERHTTGTAEITDSDIAGVKCFFADGEMVYMDSDKLYYGEYQNETLGLVKTGFQSLDFCTYYYNCDYGYCYNKVNGITIEKHGINTEFMNDEYWYLHFKKFTNGDESIQVDISDMWEPDITLAVQHYADEMTPDTLWYFDLVYDKKGQNGELIYIPEQIYWTDYDYVLYYYPEDCHVFIETEDPEIAGEYFFDGEYNRAEWEQFIEKNVNKIKRPENTLAEDDSRSNVDELWFITYNNFIKEGTDDVLQVTSMNDVLLYVEYYGANGERGEWDFPTKYDEIGKNGELIYYCGKECTMSYYPNEYRVHIETSNNIYQGDYIANNSK